jgi:hypothetical protein
MTKTMPADRETVVNRVNPGEVRKGLKEGRKWVVKNGGLRKMGK